MPQLVRAGLRFNRWLETEGKPPLDFPADVITDLRTSGDEISVFAVTESVNAERIAIAVAAGKQQPDETTFGVFDQATVESLGIVVRKSPGITKDRAVNELHYHLHVGTARRLIELAGAIAAGEIVPILKSRVKVLLREGFESGRLDPTNARLLCDKVGAKVVRPEQEEPRVAD